MLGDPRLNTECRSKIQSRDPDGSRTREPGQTARKQNRPREKESENQLFGVPKSKRT